MHFSDIINKKDSLEMIDAMLCYDANIDEKINTDEIVADISIEKVCI